MFSATQTQEVEDLIRAGLRNPKRVTVKEKTNHRGEVIQKTPAALSNFYMVRELYLMALEAQFLEKGLCDK